MKAEQPDLDHITVFFTNGTTARFHHITDLRYHRASKFQEEVVTFYYVSASDGMKNQAHVNTSNIAVIAYAC